MTQPATTSLPATLSLNGSDVELRLMARGDQERVLTFARSLHPHDLLFLRRDITQDDQMETWIDRIEAGTMITVLAVRAGEVLGYATVDRGDLSWTGHVGELRVLVGETARGLGLGMRLTREAFDIALGLGIEKMIAQMTIDQQGAIKVFESMGFRPEALLRDHVRDREGEKHDLLVLSQGVAQFQARRHALGLDGV